MTPAQSAASGLPVYNASAGFHDVSLNFVAFAAYLDPDKITGAVFAVFIITVAAAEVGLALAIVIRLFRNRGTSNVDEAALMKW